MHKVIQEEKEKLEKKIKKIVSWDKIAEAVESIMSEIPKELDPRISVGIDFSSLQGVLLHVNCQDMKEMTPILRAVSSLGFRMEKDKPEDYPEASRRTWAFNKEDRESPLKVNAFFCNGEKQVCRFVKVGTKEVNEYELKCE